ncbi:unnamed protein product, partial [Prorocentrum cordatum]
EEPLDAVVQTPLQYQLPQFAEFEIEVNFRPIAVFNSRSLGATLLASLSTSSGSHVAPYRLSPASPIDPPLSSLLRCPEHGQGRQRAPLRRILSALWHLPQSAELEVEAAFRPPGLTGQPSPVWRRAPGFAQHLAALPPRVCRCRDSGHFGFGSPSEGHRD